MNSAALRIALIGNPNCGKSALFNLLTGSRQKVANYPGVTVEKREGEFVLPGQLSPQKQVAEAARRVSVLDLPGTYSLQVTSVDERVTRDIVLGGFGAELPPDLLIAVLDATNLHLGLRLVLELKAIGRPMIVALNLIDLARQRGLEIDIEKLQRALAVPVVETVAVRKHGAQALIDAIAAYRPDGAPQGKLTAIPDAPGDRDQARVEALYAQVESLLDIAVSKPCVLPAWQDRLDAVVMHPLLGLALLATVLFLMFQAVFAWAAPLMDGLSAVITWLRDGVALTMDDGPLKSLITDGIFAGVGSVLVFLPQILILFAFILALEDSGYLPRAAFLLDRLMLSVGLSGRAFIPLLSSFACAVPGIMATRTITNPRERLVTIMIAPLMTCSARLPVYTLVIGALIPRRAVLGIFNLQGITLFALYVAGIVSSVLVAAFVQRAARVRITFPLLLELPSYRWPNLRNLIIGLYERARIFLRRVGTTILALMILLWFLSTVPGAPVGATEPAVYYSYAGQIGRALAVVFAPIGFNWQICIALVPGMAAREVAVSALGTVYALSGSDDQLANALSPIIASQWSLATALAFLAWYVYAPQCLATLAVTKRETNSWKMTALMTVYLFAMAYAAAFITYRVTLFFTH
jgi:ferrous iron transport protein B